MIRNICMVVVALGLTSLGVSGFVPDAWQVPFLLLVSVGGLVVSVLVMLPEVFQPPLIEREGQKAYCRILGIGSAASIVTLLLLYGS